MSLPIYLSHLGFLGVTELQKHNSGNAKSVMLNWISTKVSQEVLCVEHKFFLVLVWELHALEHSVLGGFERDEGEEEREVLFGEMYHTTGTAAQSWRTGCHPCLDHTTAFPSL